MGYFITRTLKSYNELLKITELNKLGIITFLPEEILKWCSSPCQKEIKLELLNLWFSIGIQYSVTLDDIVWL